MSQLSIFPPETKSIHHFNLNDMKREIKFEFIFQHPESKEIARSGGYTLSEILATSPEDLAEAVCCCDCQSVGETNVVECNCADYYTEFKLIANREFAGLKDKNGVEIYEGDILEAKIPDKMEESGFGIDISKVEFQSGCFGWIGSLTGKHFPFEESDTKYWEVIGNIHQHPELLKP